MTAMTIVQRFGRRRPGRPYEQRSAAYAVVFDASHRVACVADNKLGLFLPGGGLEPGEDALGAVHREVAEECARSLEIILPLGSAIQFVHASDDKLFELHASFFLGRFGQSLDGPAQHELSWLQAVPQLPVFFHECHRWAVQQGLIRCAA
jgi:8-oxo-dGTP diphosphatase